MEQGAPDLEGGGVEGDGGEEEVGLLGPEGDVVDADEGVVDVAVCAADTFGLAGGAGGEVDIGERRGERGRRQGLGGAGGQGDLIQEVTRQSVGGQLVEEGTGG